ncbi:MAG: PHP domain-containing protein [Nitrospinales bacterium]
MIKPRYNIRGKWFKGNVHIHSTMSDGGKDFSQLAELYSNLGYDFLYRTDHWIFSDVQTDNTDYPLLWLDGVEIHGTDKNNIEYHVLCLGTVTGILEDMDFEATLKVIFKQNVIVILAHPYWTGNTFKDALRYEFDGVEKYNHITGWLNGKSDSSVYWDMMLNNDPNTLSFAVDDAHIIPEHPGYNGGWICVNCDELSRNTIQSAIKSGHFYSTYGPQIKNITYDNNKVSIKTSPVKFIRLVGPAWKGKRAGTYKNKTIDRAEFEVPVDWQYAYIEIEDVSSKRAWTNSLFLYT